MLRIGVRWNVVNQFIQRDKSIAVLVNISKDLVKVYRPFTVIVFDLDIVQTSVNAQSFGGMMHTSLQSTSVAINSSKSM